VKWADIPDGFKLAGYLTAACLAAMGYLHGNFETLSAAEQYQVQHGQQLNLFRIQTLESQIAQYRYQLLSAQLTSQQRQWIEAEIARLQTMIACIRAGQC